MAYLQNILWLSTYIKDILLNDGMHHNADEKVKEYSTDIFPPIGVTYYLRYFSYCTVLLASYIVMNSNEHVCKR